MNSKANAKVSKGHEAEPGYQASIAHHPARMRAPKHAVRGRANVRVKKGPLEHKG